ncbi:unnamed protein product [Cuscuta campestris]|uniref:Retrotransposon gag domain-containing protein n=1 Tax=Cuscuta campestris TaxID=132261 RepID=A0A484MHT7_9ASTE|nr:unnamed protein product [Cuscuta campestris]
MSNQSQTLTYEELQVSNSALKAQVENLAKQVAQLTKMKLKMMDTPEESEEEQELEAHPLGDSNNNTRGSSNEKGATDFKVDLLTFEGKNDPDEFLEWLETVDRVFDFKDVPEDKKVKLVALKLRKYASTWWTNTATKRRRESKAPVKTWLKMRALMKKKFLPEQYVRDNFARLQQLRQGTRTVDDYTREFEELLMRVLEKMGSAKMKRRRGEWLRFGVVSGLEVCGVMRGMVLKEFGGRGIARGLGFILAVVRDRKEVVIEEYWGMGVEVILGTIWAVVVEGVGDGMGMLVAVCRMLALGVFGVASWGGFCRDKGMVGI